MTDVTQILHQIESGDPSAAELLLPLVYDELRKLAAAKMASERPDHTLQATALVHEAYVRLVDGNAPQHWGSRSHFFSAAAEAMRRILIEAARRKSSQIAGGDRRRVELGEAEISLNHAPEDLLLLDEALTGLMADDPLAGEIARLRLFAGLSVDEAAENLGMSRRTGFRHWTYARAFLQLRFKAGDSSPGH
ncbi:MAG: ECF-type sigma factor [Planctomycetaceae bacterium]